MREESKQRLSQSTKGKILSEEHKIAISNGLKETDKQIGLSKCHIPWNKDLTKETDDRIKPSPRKGKTCNEIYGKERAVEIRKKDSDSCKGRKAWNKGKHGYLGGGEHYNWHGGKSFEPYGVEFNDALKRKVRQRDSYRCQECFRHQSELKRKLSVHHIDYNKQNNKPENLISLCDSCHTQTNFGREDWTGYYNNRMEGLL